jgi:hypothetical protein
MTATKPAWIRSARFDTLFILAPAILVSLIALLFSGFIEQLDGLPPWLWLALIVGIDAGHVYSTLFRTYFVRDELHCHHALFTLIPLMAWLVGCLLYSIDSLLFWRVLAYLALFHFIRQQYGFMMIYGRNERELPGYCKLIDKSAIYLATLYPVIYWHCHGRAFHWFVEGDFLKVDASILGDLAAWLYIAVILLYLLKEISIWQATKQVNLPRNLVLTGTALSWYVGIVAFNNDLIFTASNVITHGIPYYALIWAYGNRQTHLPNAGFAYVWPWLGKLFRTPAIVLYAALLVALAYIEEGFWDGLIWREHLGLFRVFNSLPEIDSSATLAWLIPLLAVPQATHYLLDAYIWRLHKPGIKWQQVLFGSVPSQP